MYTAQFNQDIGILDVINSAAVTNTTAASTGIDMSAYRRVAYLVALEATTGGNLNAVLQASNLSNFNTVTNLTGTNLTNMNTANTYGLTEVRSDQLAQAGNSLRYVRLLLTGSAAAVTVFAVGMGKDPVQKPAPNDLNTTVLVQQAACTL